MSLNAAALKLMADKGLTAHDIAEIALASEQRSDPTAAARMAKMRANRKAGRVTRNVTREPLIEELHIPVSETKVSSTKWPCPENVDPIDWDGIKQNRKAKRAALSEGAYLAIIKKLDGWARAGWPPGPIVAEAAERGWTTVFETQTMKDRSNGNVRPIQRSRPNLSAQLRAINGLEDAAAEDHADRDGAWLALPSSGHG